jgi:hypothetical protein
MIGWLAHATGVASLGSGAAYVSALNAGAETTIIGCSPSCPSKTAILATNNTSTVASGGAFTFGPDDTTALQNLFTAAWNTPTTAPNCLAVILSGGVFLTKQPQGNTATCKMGSSGPNDTQAAVVSWSAFSGMLAPTQDFNFAGCTGGTSGKVCFWGVVGVRIQNVGINGGGASLTGTSHAVNIMELDNDTAMFGVYCVGWGAAANPASQMIGVNDIGGQPIQWSQIDGCGNIALVVNGSNAAVEQIADSFFGDTGTVGNITGAAAQFLTTFNSVGNGYDSPYTSTYEVSVSAVGNMIGDAIAGTSGTSTIGLEVQSGGRLYAYGLYAVGIGTTTSSGAVQVATGGIMGCSGCSLAAVSGGYGMLVTGTGKFFSGGMNTIVGSNANTTAVVMYTPTDTVTGTINTALAAANITPTTNFGTGCATAGQCMSAVTGDLQAFQFTVTYGTAPVSPQTLTIVFPTTAPSAPFCNLTQVGGTNAVITAPVQNNPLPTTTTAVFVITNVPIAGNTVIFNGRCGRFSG